MSRIDPPNPFIRNLKEEKEEGGKPLSHAFFIGIFYVSFISFFSPPGVSLLKQIFFYRHPKVMLAKFHENLYWLFYELNFHTVHHLYNRD